MKIIELRTIVFLMFYTNFLLAQSTIRGSVVSKNNEPIDNAYLLIFSNLDNVLLEFANSNENGIFEFKKKYTTGIYKIEITRIGFQKSFQDIVIGTDDNKSINLNIALEISTSSILNEVIITSQKPVIVKKDTIIYDISHFTKKHDESLEVVLSKIDGFKVKPNGDIEVNGKTIQKVLIDGKEVSDFGGAIITKSLSPEKVKSVEVRFDEKNKKLKESLLNDEKFVVLDIKLKENVNKSFFGKQQLTAGYQNGFEIGGLSNFFSLRNKINVQIFAENNNFGRNTIQLSQIRNIGEESKAKLFTMPVDIEDIKQRNGFNEEVYGFDNFINNDNAIVGISTNVTITKNTDLYFGSFSNYQFMINKSSNLGLFEDQVINSLELLNSLSDVNSKNKIQFKHTSDHFKIVSDANFVHRKFYHRNFVENEFENEHLKKGFFNNYFINNNIEYELSSKLGLTSGFSFKSENYEYNFDFFTNNSDMFEYLSILPNESFFQEDLGTINQINKSLFLTYKAGVFGLHSFGVKYSYNSLENYKSSNSVDFNLQNELQTIAIQNSVFHKIYYEIDRITLNFESEAIRFKFPFYNSENYYYKSKTHFQYATNLNFDISKSSNFTALISNKLDYFPLQKATLGNTLLDFQTVFVPNQNLEPFFNRTFSFTYMKKFNTKSDVDVAFLQGESNNLNNQTFGNEIVLINANQLQSKYYAFSAIFKNSLKKLPLQIILEPEFLNNTSEFIFENEIKKTTTKRFLMGLKSSYQHDSVFSLFYFPKYSHFLFNNNNSNIENTFSFLSQTFGTKIFFLDQKLLINVNYKQVNFFQSKSNFNNLNISIVFKSEKKRWFVNCNNILNSKNFITQDFNQSLLNINNNIVFSRFLNFGFEYKIN